MSLKLGNINISDVKLGNSQVNSVYFGTQKIWDKTPDFITSGLIMRIDASNPLSYDGTNIFKDISGNGNNATIVNGATKNANNIQLNGTNQYLNFGDKFDIGTGSLTYGLWCAMSNKLPVGGIMGKTVYGGIVGRNGFHQDTSNSIAYLFEDSAVRYSNYPSSVIFNNTFVFISVVIERTVMILYVNGVEVQRMTLGLGATNYNNSVLFLIGVYGNGTGTSPQVDTYRNMRIGEAFVYNRALSATEMMTNFNATKSKYL